MRSWQPRAPVSVSTGRCPAVSDLDGDVAPRATSDSFWNTEPLRPPLSGVGAVIGSNRVGGGRAVMADRRAAGILSATHHNCLSITWSLVHDALSRHPEFLDWPDKVLFLVLASPGDRAVDHDLWQIR